jgi:hypothetical protein
MKKILNIILICAIVLCVCCAYSESLATTTDLSPQQEVIEEVVEPTPEPTPEPEVHVNIEIWYEFEGEVAFGSTVHFYSHITGGEGRILEYQWQYHIEGEYGADGQELWHDIPNATQSTYSYIITRENYKYYYRLQVTHWAKGEERE